MMPRVWKYEETRACSVGINVQNEGTMDGGTYRRMLPSSQ